MSRARSHSEYLKKAFYEAAYQCVNSRCGYLTKSEDATPDDVMAARLPVCPKCEGVMEAVWTHTTLPGHIVQPARGVSKSAQTGGGHHDRKIPDKAVYRGGTSQ